MKPSVILILIGICLVASIVEAKRRTNVKSTCSKKSTHVKEDFWSRGKRENNLLRKKKICKPTCESGFKCKRVNRCIGTTGPTDVPPAGSACDPQLYQNYCCQFDSYNPDNSLKYVVIPIDGACKLGSGQAGTCVKTAGEAYASCQDNKNVRKI